LIRLLDARSEIVNRVAVSKTVEAGEWLAAHYPPEARILYDFYSYVPPVFEDARLVWGGTLPVLSAYSPRLVLVNDQMQDRFDEPQKAEIYFWGREDFIAKFEYYSLLENGQLDYKLVKDFGELRIY
jgi:hypothetical protein